MIIRVDRRRTPAPNWVGQEIPIHPRCASSRANGGQYPLIQESATQP